MLKFSVNIILRTPAALAGRASLLNKLEFVGQIFTAPLPPRIYEGGARRARGVPHLDAEEFQFRSNLPRFLAETTSGLGRLLSPQCAHWGTPLINEGSKNSIPSVRQTPICLSVCYSSSNFRTAMKASLGTDTVPKVRIRFLPSFCFSSSFFFRVMSPP